MKIIGKTIEGVLISATEDEVARMFGQYSTYGLLREKRLEVKVGLEIKIDEMFNHIRQLREQYGKCEKIASELRVMADAIDLRGRVFIDGIAEKKEAAGENTQAGS